MNYPIYFYSNATSCDVEGETGTSDEMVKSTESARIPRLSWVDDLLQTYFTSPRPSAWRLLPKTFAATIPLSDSELRGEKKETERDRGGKWESQQHTPNITYSRLPASVHQGEEDAQVQARPCVPAEQDNKRAKGPQIQNWNKSLSWELFGREHSYTRTRQPRWVHGKKSHASQQRRR